MNEDGSWSIHGAVKLSNYGLLKNEFVKDFCAEYKSNTWCFEFHEPEALVVSH